MSSAASTSNAMDLEAATAQPAQQTTTSQRTWTDWLKSFSFVLPEPKEDEETYTHVSDPREQHFGYQCSAAEEVRLHTWLAELVHTQTVGSSGNQSNIPEILTARTVKGARPGMQEAEAVYTAMLAATQGEDYSDIEQNKFLQTPCKDLSGRAVVLVVARYLPADVQDADRLYQCTCRQLDTVADDKYCVIYVHTEASYWENSPGILFLRQAYERCVGCPDRCSLRLLLVRCIGCPS